LTLKADFAKARRMRALVTGAGGFVGAWLAGHLRAYFRRRLPFAHQDAEDLLQETLLAVHTQRHTYDRDQPLTAWVHAIARYKLADAFRRRGRRDSRHVPLDDVEELLGGSDTEAIDSGVDVGRLLATLPDRQRLPIELVKLAGRSVVDAARRTGMSESAVKVGIHRGIKALAARWRSAP